MQGGLGPMQGQASHFVVFAPEKVEYGIKRYTNEVKRLYGVIENALSDGREWLAAGEYSIADIANFSWMYVHFMAGMSLSTLTSHFRLMCADMNSLTVDISVLKHTPLMHNEQQHCCNVCLKSVQV